MIRVSVALKSARSQAVIEFLMLGPNPAKAKIYSGTKPTSLGGSLGSAVLLASVPLAEPVGTLNTLTGQIEITTTTETMAVGDGVASFAILVNGNDEIGWDCDVSTMAGAGDLKMADTNIYAGGSAQIVSGILG